MNCRLIYNFLPFLCVSLFIFGCTTSKTIKGPDGTNHQLISCGSIEDCYTKAAEVCGGKYKIINTSTDVDGSEGDTSSTTNLLVKCSR